MRVSLSKRALQNLNFLYFRLDRLRTKTRIGQTPKWTKSRFGQKPELDKIQEGQNPKF